ncbi:MAG TPA: hypothetical protein VFV10_20655 [Gammaproteobacteria bacterium]|nr:hypothetical protein [Gammaproteobacteria bacterium]
MQMGSSRVPANRARSCAGVAAAVVLAALAWSWPAGAQEGFPLKGTWLGTWQGNQVQGESVFLTLDWDGKTISGVINPGTDDIAVKQAALDPDGWKVHIEADAKDKSGQPLHYVIDGHIEHLELPNRSIIGTWKSERGNGAFDVSRQ